MIINRIIILKSLGTIIGAILGFLNWHFIGCENGCTIQSVWWRMSLWGTIMGYLTTSILIDFFKNKTINKK